MKEAGLYNTFMENFPITDTRNNFVLEFLDYFVDPPYNSRMYRKRFTHSVPLKARLKAILYRSRARRF
jgi:DNA-directed RNA polymerase subunit beta